MDLARGFARNTVVKLRAMEVLNAGKILENEGGSDEFSCVMFDYQRVKHVKTYVHGGAYTLHCDFLIGKVRFNNMRFEGTQFSHPAGCFCWAFVGPLRGLGCFSTHVGPTTGDQQRRDCTEISMESPYSMVVSSRKIIVCFCLNPILNCKGVG